jgi:hypothetical protein
MQFSSAALGSFPEKDWRMVQTLWELETMTEALIKLRKRLLEKYWPELEEPLHQDLQRLVKKKGWSL